MDKIEFSGDEFRNLGRINIIVGKNGCGKSTLYKKLDAGLPKDEYHIRYITPERGGNLNYDAGVEQSLNANTNYLPSTRRVNQFNQFRQQSVAQFKKLEILALRQIEKDLEIRKGDYTFDSVIDEINVLLDNIEISRTNTGFSIHLKNGGPEIKPEKISSGEAELISLAIECKAFEKECIHGKYNFLLLDEPDLHLHPDLQSRFADYVNKLASNELFQGLIATHSTSLIAALSTAEDSRIAFMTFGDHKMSFTPISEILSKILPVFGAHPLSNVAKEKSLKERAVLP